MPGSLAREPRSDNGFEYDAILLVEGDCRTSAELTFQEKNVIEPWQDLPGAGGRPVKDSSPTAGRDLPRLEMAR
jgi:hypothetical protein